MHEGDAVAMPAAGSGRDPDELYAVTPKIVTLGHGTPDADARMGPAALYAAEAEGDGIGIRRGDASAPLTAPLPGVTVIAAAPGTGPAAERLLAFWHDAGLAPPPVVETDGATLPAAGILAALAEGLDAENRAIAADCLGLDRQILALREQLEDSRNLWQSALQALTRVTGDLPTLGLSALPEGAPLTLEPDLPLRQLLPYAGYITRAVGLHLAEGGGPRGGRLRIRLLAREDETELAAWNVFDRPDGGWVILSVPSDIPTRYRNIELDIAWLPDEAGTAEPPLLSVAPAAGLDRQFVELGGVARPMTRLATRVWVGESGRVAGAQEADPGTPETSRRYRVHVGDDRLGGSRALVERSLGQWPWHKVGTDEILVHPTPQGISAVAVSLRSIYPITGVQAMLASPNPLAPEIEFALVAMSADPDAAAIDALAGGAAPALPGALGHRGWQPVAAGSSAVVGFDLVAPVAGCELVLMTRVPGGGVDNAHAYFRRIRMICET